MYHTNSNSELTLQLELWPFHLDLDGRYPLNRIVSRMIHVAGEHASHYGFGIQRMMEHGATWVLSRMTIDFLRPVDVALPLSITTGVHDWAGLTTDRVIRLSQNGAAVAEAMSKWVAIGVEKRMPIPIDKVLTDDSLKSKYPEVHLPVISKRLWGLEVQEKLVPVYEHQVRYSDLDLNRHVNSSVWVSLALDAIPLEILSSRSIKRAHLHFIKEAREGVQLCVMRYHTDGAEYLQVNNGDVGYFQLMLEW